MQIRVNADDRCFGSILSLYRGGFLDVSSGPKLIESVTDGKIVTPSAEFVLRRAGERSVSEHADDGIGAGGATWFAGLRGEDVTLNSNSEWISFIESVSNHFHRNHSFLEYNSQGSDPTPQEVERDIARVKRVVASGWQSWGSEAEIREARSKGAMEIFGVGLRLDISNVGEPLAVIGRLYFCRRRDGELYPLRASTAKLLDASIMEYDDESGAKVTTSYRNEIIGQLLVKVEDCFRRREGASTEEDGLEDWLYIYDKEDIEALSALAEKGHKGEDGAVPLVCTGAKLLNIFHMIKPTRLYEVVFGGDTVLTAEFAMENEITLNCALCNGAYPIIENNIARLVGGGEVVIDPDADGLGIPKELLSRIPFSKHVKPISCDSVGCKKYRCSVDLFSYEGRQYCKACQRRDVVYPIGDKYYPTQALAFSSATLTLVPRFEMDPAGKKRPLVRTCSLCGRTFEIVGNARAVCSFCSCQGADEEEAARLYKKYSGALPLHVRMANAAKKRKLCYEDSEFIMYVFGSSDGDESRYYLNKYNLCETGKLSGSPKKAETV